MALDTYTNLQTAIVKWLNRVGDTDTTASIPDMISLAEAQMHRRFVGRVRQGLPIPRRLYGRSTDSSIITSTEYLAVPTDFAGPVLLDLTSSSPNIELDYLEPENLRQWKVSSAIALAGEAPRYYTVIGTEFQIFPVADTSYTAELTYIKRVAALSGSNATNWILTDYPDAYLYGALVASIEFLMVQDSRAAGWETKFSTAIDDICNADPLPSDKSTLRTEFPLLTRFGRWGGYNISSDSWGS